MRSRRKPKADNNLLPQPRKQRMTYKDILTNYQDKVASINFRNDMIKRAKNSNYVNEHNRLSGALRGTILPDATLHRITNRQNHLRKVFLNGAAI